MSVDTPSPTRHLGRVAWLALVLGAAVGLLAGIYLLGVAALTHLVWDGHHPRLPLPRPVAVVVTCVLGGLVVGLLRRRHDADQPHDLQDTLLELDRVIASDTPQPPPSMAWLTRSTLLGVVSLVAGASLGPEAPLLVLASGLGQRMARILRTTRQEAAYLSTAGALSGLLGGPLGPLVLPAERSRRPTASVRLLGPGVIAAVAGLVTLLLVLPDLSGLRYDVPDVPTDAATLVWAALGGLLASLAGIVLLAASGPLRHLAETRLPSTVARASVGGLVLGLCGAATPLALFSGEHEGQTFIDEVGSYAVGTLLLLLVAKSLATIACTATGWFGGQIFPAAFVGMATAALPLTVAPEAPTTALVAAGAAAGATMLLRRPLASAVIMLFFFPLTASTPLLVGAGVAALVLGVLGPRIPEAEAPGHGS